MSYVTSHIIAIDNWAEKLRNCTDSEAQQVILKTIKLHEDPDRFENSISGNCSGGKGGFFIIAGDFNHYPSFSGRELARFISTKLKCRVVYTCHAVDDLQSNHAVFEEGKLKLSEG